MPLNLTCLHCLQHFFFEHLFNLYCPLIHLMHSRTEMECTSSKLVCVVRCNAPLRSRRKTRCPVKHSSWNTWAFYGAVVVFRSPLSVFDASVMGCYSALSAPDLSLILPIIWAFYILLTSTLNIKQFYVLFSYILQPCKLLLTQPISTVLDEWFCNLPSNFSNFSICH